MISHIMMELTIESSYTILTLNYQSIAVIYQLSTKDPTKQPTILLAHKCTVWLFACPVFDFSSVLKHQ
ncbi:hypothetical protein CICLE_v10026906mg [Citrus x clementina]|uniref:Uncharacterized protein n=1 Tax=Citrus clementina TaxID=85681 RepID=V4SLR3_CITCL|nr:hypothetical protein CICLE_v10026906mg [Citrus x clementina]